MTGAQDMIRDSINGAQEYQPQPNGARYPWPVSDPALLYGLAGDFVKVVEPQSEADPIALLAQFLVAFGNVAGRHAYRVADGARHYLNLFAVIVGATAKARKGSAWAWTKCLFDLVDPGWANERIQGGLSSGEGLIWAVRDPIERREAVREKGRPTGRYQMVETDAGVSDKRLLVVESEFASVLKMLAREGNTLSTTIRHAWDSGDLRVLTKNSPAKATGAHISIAAHITCEELLRHLTETETANGFGNRFLWLCARRSKMLPFGGKPTEKLQKELQPVASRVRDAVKRAQSDGEFHFHPEAPVGWSKVYPTLSADRLGLLGALLARAEAQTLRLACLYAALDGTLEVHIHHLRAALALWEYAERSAEYIFGKRLGDPDADTILDALRTTPEGLTRTQIRDLFQRHRSETQIGRALKTLRDGGYVHSETAANTGRPAEVWTAT